MISLLQGRGLEFFEGDNGRLSSRNLTIILSMSIASIVVLWMAYQDTLTEKMFGIYLLAGAGIYGLGKWTDAGVKKKQIEADAGASNGTADKTP